MKSAIQLKKEIFLAIYSEIDLIEENNVMILLSDLERRLDSKILSIIEESIVLNSIEINQIIFDIKNITSPNYILKSIKYEELKDYISRNKVALLKRISLLDSQIDDLLNFINSKLADSSHYNKLTDKLNSLTILPIEQKEQALVIYHDEIDTYVRINELIKKLINENFIFPDNVEGIITKCNEWIEKNDLFGAEKYLQEEYSKHTRLEKNSNNKISESNFIINKDPSKSKKCFIATAAMGNEDHYIVNDFRIFRDTKLNSSLFGKVFIKFYYLTAPPFAFIVNNNNFIRIATAKYFIKPLHNIITKLIN